MCQVRLPLYRHCRPGQPEEGEAAAAERGAELPAQPRGRRPPRQLPLPLAARGPGGARRGPHVTYLLSTYLQLTLMPSPRLMPLPEVILLSGFFLVSLLEEVLYTISRYIY